MTAGETLALDQRAIELAQQSAGRWDDDPAIVIDGEEFRDELLGECLAWLPYIGAAIVAFIAVFCGLMRWGR